jgi:hypothetical protein
MEESGEAEAFIAGVSSLSEARDELKALRDRICEGNNRDFR